ncbi:trehalose operon repressor [Spiroplasma corruscae]|uniref:Trehalose operon repressor n=1 Tax=Spiroplasma corruscae TaxID=216934 RepID=A0A222EPH3_9MOLU|nr:LacI family DNA-binding transcriptional regulator [Spiroplasma corruscae]ASP28429.1 trehalose operon repressor [Spiroplasma corruscae]
MSKEKITYHSIAKKAGVGVGTVSRYFNNYNISNEAKQKIKQVLDEVEYVPNYAASTLKKPIKDVYLIVPFNSEEKANMEIVNGVKNALVREKINFFVFISSEFSEIYKEDLKILQFRNSFGLILLLPKFTTKELYEQIEKIKTTKVIVYNRKLNNVDFEGINDEEMFKELATLIDNKYNNKNIAFIGLDDEDLTSGLIRTKSFINNVYNNNVFKHQLKANNHESVYEIIEDIINKDKPDIFVCATHTIALSVHNYLLENNIRNKYIVTDITRLGKTQNIKNFDISIIIDYASLGYRIGNKLLGKDSNLEKLYKIV